MKLPSFTESAYKTAGYVCTGCVTLSGLFLCYELVFVSGWKISAEWNMFKSWLIWPLYIIGLIVAIGNLGKNHYSQDTIIETEYSDGTRKREKSYDITDVMFGQIIAPLLGHFVLEPLVVAAVIYYPLMCVVAFVGRFVPYILAALVLSACFGTFRFTSIVGSAKGSVLIVLLAVFLSGGFGYGGYAIYRPHTPTQPVSVMPKVDEAKETEPTATPAAGQGQTDVDDSDFDGSSAAEPASAAQSVNDDDFE